MGMSAGQLADFVRLVPREKWGEMFPYVEGAADRFDAARATWPTFMGVVIRNRESDARRREVRRRHVRGGQSEDWHEAMWASPATKRDDSADELERALAWLREERPRDYRALELVYARGLDYQSAAFAAGLPLGTLKSTVHRAVGLLAKRLEADS